MPGLFDNDDDKKQEAQVSTIAATPPPYMANYRLGINKSQPGQLDMLSQNLAAGGYGTGSNPAEKASSLRQWMDTFYKESPMAVYDNPATTTLPPISPVAAPAAAPAPAPAPVAVAAPSAAPVTNYYRHPVLYGDGTTGWEAGGGHNSR